MSTIANTLVTATPQTAGLPTVSGTTNSAGQVTLPMAGTVKYNLQFSGPGIGKVSGFTPASSSFTLYKVKNKGTLSMSISGQKLSGGKSVYAFYGSVPVKALKTFTSWKPGTLFKKATSATTSLIMPQSNVSMSYVGVAPKKLYVVDGIGLTASIATNNAYDTSTNTWSTKASDTTARANLVAGVVGSKLYAIDGKTTVAVKFNHAYDPTTNTWSTKASDTTARFGLGAGVIGSKLYAVDGSSTTTFSTAANHAYDPSTNTWSTKASDITKRQDVTASVITSKLYAVYSSGNRGPNHSYNPSINTWTSKAKDPPRSGDAAGGVMGSKMYTIDGGSSSTRYTKFNHAYDPTTNTWSTKASDTTARSQLAAGVIGSKLYAVDGSNGGALAINHAYDPSTNTWSTKASDITKRFYPAAGVI